MSTWQAVLDTLTGQTGVKFAYNKRSIDLRTPASIPAQQGSMQDILQQLFANSAVEFAVTGRQISLFRARRSHYTISGYIRDAASGELLIGANIYETRTYAGTGSNEYGFFSLSLPPGRHILKASYVGFQEQADTIELLTDHQIDWVLSAGNTLSEVVVTRNTELDDDNNPDRHQSAATKVDTRNAAAFSSVLGEHDMMKVIQLRPGVAFGTEGTSGFHVQGGSPDQNLILLDGVPLYNATHLFGFASIFNASAINSATFYQSGFPARFTGRLSSVLDVRMKDGNNRKMHGGLKMSIISGTAYLEGPIKKGKSSFLLSGRRTWLDLIAATAQIGNKEVKTNYNFYDLNAKANFRISPKDRLLFSFYGGDDRFVDRRAPSSGVIDEVSPELNSESLLKWGNKAIALRWNRVIGPKLFSNTTLFFGNFNYRAELFLSQLEVVSDIEAASKIRDYGLKYDLEYQPNVHHHFRMGANYTLHDFTPGFLEGYFSTRGRESEFREGASPMVVHEAGAYAEDEMNLHKKFRLNVGLHLTLVRTDRRWFARPQARSRLTYIPNPHSSFSLSYSGMAQLVHLLSSNGIGLLPTDLWVPSTADIPPGTAHQLAFTYRTSLHPKWFLEAGAYNKWMNNLIEYQSGATLTNSTANWESRIESGRGRSYGAFLLLERAGIRTSARLAYALSRTNRRFRNLNQNEPFPYRFDRRHNLNFSLKHQWPGKKDKTKEVGMVWVLASGHLINLPTARYRDLNGSSVDVYNARNNYRFPAYHRLDFSKSNSRVTKAGYTRTWRWGVYNLYGRANIFSAALEENTADMPTTIIGQSVFPFPIPYLQYEIDF